jgi:glycosyltransferase involved in cell wall biosynthesis
LKKSETPYFLYAHGMLDPALQDIFRWKQWQKRICWALVERKVARDARAVLFTRREEAQKAAESFRPYQVTSAVVPCCVIPPPEDRAEAREAFFECWPKARGKRVLLYLGRLNPVKGCDLLIEAFSRMADRDARLHLVMVGPSDPPNWIDQLKLRVRALGIEPRVTWPGMLSGDMKWAAFRIAEAFVLPSYHENFGIAIAEALACGTPVLISNHVHIWREIFEEEAGLVSEAGLDGTVSLLDRWLSLSASDRGAMRRNALRCFQKRFEGDAAATQLIEVLTAGINGRDLNHQEIAK